MKLGAEYVATQTGCLAPQGECVHLVYDAWVRTVDVGDPRRPVSHDDLDSEGGIACGGGCRGFALAGDTAYFLSPWELATNSVPGGGVPNLVYDLVDADQYSASGLAALSDTVLAISRLDGPESGDLLILDVSSNQQQRILVDYPPVAIEAIGTHLVSYTHERELVVYDASTFGAVAETARFPLTPLMIGLINGFTASDNDIIVTGERATELDILYWLRLAGDGKSTTVVGWTEAYDLDSPDWRSRGPRSVVTAGHLLVNTRGRISESGPSSLVVLRPSAEGSELVEVSQIPARGIRAPDNLWVDENRDLAYVGSATRVQILDLSSLTTGQAAWQ